MITEDYVSFETAKLLKEKGFNSGVCKNSPHYYYNTDGEFSGPSWDTEYTAPTLQMAMKWLMVTYGYYIWVDYSRFDFDKNQPFLWNIVKAEIDGDYYGGTYHKTYEQACEAAIRYCLENLI